jgi:uncharacterized protein YjcR
MSARRIPTEIHDEVVAKAKAGEKVADLASIYGISTKTIYGWLSKDSGEEIVSVIKYNKLKRENEELKRIIGKLTLDMSWGKKG